MEVILMSVLVCLVLLVLFAIFMAISDRKTTRLRIEEDREKAELEKNKLASNDPIA